MRYYLKCAICGEQIHYRETGKDADGFTVIETWPCETCQADELYSEIMEKNDLAISGRGGILAKISNT